MAYISARFWRICGVDEALIMVSSSSTNILFAIYDSSDEIVEMTPDGTVLREYALPGDNQEGIALARQCAFGTATAFVSEDSGGVWRYEDYPLSCPAIEVPAFSHPGAFVACAMMLLVVGLIESARSRTPVARGARGGSSRLPPT